MAKGNRRKGREGENEYAAHIGGERISVPGLPGPDVQAPDDTLWEVKRRKQHPGWLYDYVKQAVGEGAEGVALRSDRHRWLIVIDADMFNERWERKR